MDELCLSIPIKPLQAYAKSRVKRKADDKDIRLHLYLWLSKWMTWHPDLTFFSVDTHGKGQWTKDDQVIRRRMVIVKWAHCFCRNWSNKAIDTLTSQTRWIGIACSKRQMKAAPLISNATVKHTSRSCLYAPCGTSLLWRYACVCVCVTFQILRCFFFLHS